MMRKLEKNKYKLYYIKLIGYAILTLIGGIMGIYTLTYYLEDRTVTAKIGQAIQAGEIISEEEILKFIQHFPITTKKIIIETIRDGITQEDVQEVYAYYKEYNEREQKE